MLVLTPDYSGSISIPVRSYTADQDYLFVVYDEQSKIANAYRIEASGITYDGYRSSFPVSLSVELKEFYATQLFSQDGTIADFSEENQAMTKTLFTYLENGNLIAELNYSKIFCSDQTDKERYELQQGNFKEHITANDYKYPTDE